MPWRCDASARRRRNDEGLFLQQNPHRWHQQRAKNATDKAEDYTRKAKNARERAQDYMRKAEYALKRAR